MATTPYVVVIGGANMDIAGRPHVATVPRDSTAGTVRLSAGGVGRNIAHNLALLGVDVRLVTCFGQDAQADALIEGCRAAGVDVTHSFVVAGGATSTYLYLTDETGEMQFAINDMAIMDQLTPERMGERWQLLNDAAAVVADTNIPAETLRWLAHHVSAPLFCDPISTVKAHRLAPVLGSMHAIKPNLLEAETLSGVRIDDEDDLWRAAQALVESGVEQVFVSLGADGLLCAQRGRTTRLEPKAAQVRNTTGGGDAMMAGLVWTHLQGFALEQMGRAGLAASAIAVESDETVSPLMSEAALRSRIAQGRQL